MADELNLEKLETFLSTTEVAEMFDVSPGVVRREAKKDAIPGAVNILGRLGFDPELVQGWEPPEGRTGGIKREDGRVRWKILLNDDEKAKLVAEGYEIEDPRAAGKARRAARKAAEKQGGEQTVAEEANDGDPFSDFE